MDPLRISVKDMPAVDTACKCALPVILTSIENPQFPGLLGTCFAVEVGGKVVFVTAGHVIGEVDLRKTRVSIPLGVGWDWPAAEIARIASPVANDGLESACDFSVMIPANPPSGVGDFAALSTERVANMAAAQPGAMFAVAGYPGKHPAGKGINYDHRVIGVTRFISIGTYVGPGSIRGCHAMKFSTVTAGGPYGLSGSPAIRVLHNADDSWTPALAGVVIMGNRDVLHFLDVAYVATFLNNERFRAFLG